MNLESLKLARFPPAYNPSDAGENLLSSVVSYGQAYGNATKPCARLVIVQEGSPTRVEPCKSFLSDVGGCLTIKDDEIDASCDLFILGLEQSAKSSIQLAIGLMV
jgi:hypothetical protein